MRLRLGHCNTISIIGFKDKKKDDHFGGSNLKMKIILFIAIVVVMLSSPIIAATSNTTIKFGTGPFNCSVDLNTPCHDIKIGKPIQKEMADGTDYYVNYPVEICGVSISFSRYNKSDVLDVESGVSTQSLFGNLISQGVDMKSIQIVPRNIDGKKGAAGSASSTRLNKDVYMASYIVSSNSVCIITTWGANNYKKMASILDSIHVEGTS
jgi:hypothetical protein